MHLTKWRKKCVNVCDICGEVETIEHMLFLCAYTDPVWNLFTMQTGYVVSLDDIILGVDNHDALTFAISLTAYLIYKDWLIHSLEGTDRPQQYDLRSIEIGIANRCAVYKSLKWTEITNILDKF